MRAFGRLARRFCSRLGGALLLGILLLERPDLHLELVDALLELLDLRAIGVGGLRRRAVRGERHERGRTCADAQEPRQWRDPHGFRLCFAGR
ncbi:MAG TPA: hypothetical protein VKE51_21150 [Vicinamibacterales bacterium]|nr:hypothetical protein [Vicinamibacterales bacterium]